MIWATVNYRSCFCWLYTASPFSPTKNVINLILVLTIWWCPCVKSSLIFWKRVFAVTSVFSWQNSVSLCPASFCTPRPNLPVTPGISWLPTFAFQSPMMNLLFSHSVMSNSLRPHGLQHSRPLSPHHLLEFTQTYVHWVGNAISPSHPLSSPSPAFNLSQHQSFPVNRLFTSGGPSIGTSASASVLPINIQGWFPLGLTGLISLLSKGLSRVFSSTTVQRHQFFDAQPFLLSNS